MKRYSIFGAGNYLSDIFDIVHANDGKVMEICHNAPDADPDRGITIKQRIDLLGYEVRYYRSLDEFIIEGIKTTIPFHQKLMKHEDFRKGNYTTKFMETFEI